jgi:ribonuclease HI
MKLQIFTDGGSRGNPGEGAIGIVIQSYEQEKWVTLKELGKRIGVCTNNEAEYTAVIEAYKTLKGLGSPIEALQFFMDSSLVVNQLNGIFKIKEARLRDFVFTIRSFEQEMGVPTFYTFIPREQNKRADELVNRALDTI